MDKLILFYEPTVLLFYFSSIGILAGFLLGRSRRDVAISLLFSILGGTGSVLPTIFALVVEWVYTFFVVMAIVSAGFGLGTLARMIVESREDIVYMKKLVALLAEEK